MLYYKYGFPLTVKVLTPARPETQSVEEIEAELNALITAALVGTRFVETLEIIRTSPIRRQPAQPPA